jgi:chemotaxis protein CheD
VLLPATDLKSALPRAMLGFEHVRRYRDLSSGKVLAKLLPGDFYVTRHDEVLDTVLGSCVSACIRNPNTGIGGMNHFMLPHPRANERNDSWGSVAGSATRYGNASMEQLINKILAGGGSRTDLEVKIFGGARVLAATTDVGQRNVEFVRAFIKQEGLRLSSEDVGNNMPRHIQYFPFTGKVRVKHLGSSQSVKLISEEVSYRKALDRQPVAGEIDLF